MTDSTDEKRCPCDLHDREDYFPDCPIAKSAREIIAAWEANPKRQAIAKMLGVHPRDISDADIERVCRADTSHRMPNLQQIPRRKVRP